MESARARGQGGDPARYAKENPEAIYDAMGDEREPEILDFVLRSGANPDAQRHPALKGTPMFMGVTDGDKVALLLKYGADVNARDHNGYTPLSYVLFSPFREYKVPTAPRSDQKVRMFSKIEIVRLLLDRGAEINGNLGGWGGDGALGLARREDKDVIGLLIERGATFKDSGQSLLQRLLPTDNHPTNLGPLTIAIQRDRDDLALALLGRDGKLAANDDLALLEATRRGFSELALAILLAGGDPNVADSHGVTPLSWAVRRKDDVLILALRRAGARAPIPAKQRVDARNLDAFGLMAADKIDDVALFDPDRFLLDWTGPREQAVFAFYGDATGGIVPITCERAAAFRIVANFGDRGAISVGVCRREARRVRDATTRAKTAVSRFVSDISVPNPESLKTLGWDWQTMKLKGGWEGYAFPLFMVGHGVLWLDTVVVLDPLHSVAVVVQAELHQLCEPTGGIRTRIRTPLCDETTKALRDIALSMAPRS